MDHNMKTCEGVLVKIRNYSSRHYMKVSGQFHALAAFPAGKMPSILISSEAGWEPELIWTLYSREKLVPTLGSES
jgi:hypothetical protein